MKYIPVIGMEVHVELKTKSKMFCSCPNGQGLEKEPNTHICPVCTGQPGTLPVPNRAAIESVQRAGLALGCSLRLESKFDRKNYFYPDLPKGYQISQYDKPLCEAGALVIDGKTFRVTRIHLEEDTGKLSHATGGSKATLVDFNRAGVPLMELVTEPDFESGKEARAFCQRLRQILRYIGISDADMEKGQMRCEVNISLYKEGEDRLSGTKVEIKNLNSFRSVERAADYEIVRQTEVLQEGKKVTQETRGWDESRGATVSQRAKESAHDYRYFPEPDIPALVFSEEHVEMLRRSLPELPEAKETRFVEEFGLPKADAVALVSERDIADYFEQVTSELLEKKASGEAKSDAKKLLKLAANYFLTETRKFLSENGNDMRSVLVTPENYAEFIGLVADGAVNSSGAQTVLAEMMKGGDSDPSHIVERLGLTQTNDEESIVAFAEEALAANQKSVDDYRSGKENALQFLVGQVMKLSKGKANPEMAREVLLKKLKEKI
ncbi:MAG: Asp-tRNA(Asn)/Glu-tRNA(Gln) amidotransferase subunit GatB [Candidatus Moraniibacteriota bacterium]|nr:MAG: Asp-tRNA(Asn)/Glu-tRNA(Gln) amidotransferase subunit GatB [Candidatus Moranbacteria bacterium]